MSGYKPLSAGARRAKLLSRIVQLYYGEQLTMQEIADELHLTRGTVCKHLQKASARLSHVLQYSALGMHAEQSRDR